MNDITTQRGRLIDLAARADGFAPLRRATGALVGTVYDGGSMPTSLPGQFLVRPTAVAGAESEGSTGALSQAGARSAVVTVVGTKVPVVGDVLVTRRQGARWVAQLGGGGYTETGISLAGCPCTNLPATLFMHVASQPTNVQSLVFPATLQYGPKPSDVAAYTSDPTGYYSTSTYTSSDGYYTYRYWFGCSQGLYFVSGLMTPASSLGYPGRFLIMTWLIGVAGNTCSPFSLHAGSTDSQTFASQGITIDGSGPP